MATLAELVVEDGPRGLDGFPAFALVLPLRVLLEGAAALALGFAELPVLLVQTFVTVCSKFNLFTSKIVKTLLQNFIHIASFKK